jgi:ectoine hydroxylase-related dioxygenase (phytanoyl-CoA dioxygenase family)
MAVLPLVNTVSFRDSTPIISEPSELRVRAESDGYLFFRNLLPVADVLRVRAAMLAEARHSGWLRDGANDDTVKTELEPVVEGGGDAWHRFYCRVYRRRELHALNHHPALIRAFEALFGDGVLSHPRVIGRAMFPRTQRFTTPPHQDYFYIRGTPDTWTTWIPLGDCPEELGGLAVAPGSHLDGLLPVERAEGAGGHSVGTRREQTWASGAFSAGDVLAFHSHTVHQARDNCTPDRLRLSCDFRFQAVSAPVHPSSLEPHMNCLSWAEIYQGWGNPDALKYYWQRLDLMIEQARAS